MNLIESTSISSSDLHKTVLFDIDGTLIDQDYQLTALGMPEAVELAQSHGWQVGLNSDTPYEGMKYWRDQLGMNGPLITERGALTVVKDAPVEVLVGQGAVFETLRNQAQDYLSSVGIMTWQGNPVECLRAGSSLPFAVEPNEPVVLINQYRTQSFGCFVRVVENGGKLGIRPEITQSIIASLRMLYPDEVALDEDYNDEHGLVIVSSALVNKRIGTRALLQRLAITKLAMVGNSTADYLGGDIAYHIAVGDAENNFKDKADYVTPAFKTAGAIQAIEFLVSSETIESKEIAKSVKSYY
jgi:hydroxymethylpyrimidine pyrophosphatase-like HAD family hydrolase